MNDDTIRKLTGQAQLDQAMAGLNQFAATLGAFHKSLLENGIPEPLADDMVRDWFRLQMSKQLWPDAPPTWEG